MPSQINCHIPPIFHDPALALNWLETIKGLIADQHILVVVNEGFTSKFTVSGVGEMSDTQCADAHGEGDHDRVSFWVSKDGVTLYSWRESQSSPTPPFTALVIRAADPEIMKRIE